MSRQEIEDKVAEYVELTEQGQAVDPTSYASRYPKIERELLAALAALREAESLLPSSAGDLPSSVGSYRVLGLIGSGGMGRVLRVSSPEHPQRDLALKLLHPFAALDPRSAERFRREGEVLKSLEHPNIVKVHEVGLIGSNPFLVMDRVEGRSLAQVIRDGRARPKPGAKTLCDRLDLPGEGSGHARAARIVAQLARAVAAVHRAGSLHRDIKPANVILRDDGSAVLVDFGLVHWSAAETLTKTGDLLGTPQYMPPEQARGESTDERADVYGLGALLYELLTLRPAHAGDDAMKVLDAVRNRPVPRIRERAPDVPRRLATVVHRALAFRAHQRTKSADDLADDLECFLEGRPVSARGTSVLERLDALWTFHRQAIATGVLALALGLGGFAFLRHRAQSEVLAAEHSFDGALRAWIEHDDKAAIAQATDALAHSSDHRWAGLLAALAQDREPDASQDGAATAIASGWKKHRAKDHGQAVEDFARAAELAPGDAFPAVLLALEARLAGDDDRAQRELSAALSLVPRSARLLEELGSVLYAQRELVAAEKSFDSALELAPGSARVWEQLARTRFRAGRFDSGLDAAERAFQLMGEKANPRILMTYGVLLEVNGRRSEAREMFERVAVLTPESASPPTSIAMSLDKEHKMREAQDAYWQAAQIGPPAKALMCLAYLYAGSNSPGCAQCREFFTENPDLLDPDRAESCALGALEADGGREPGLPPTAAQVANQIERPAAIRAKLESLRAAATEDKLIARYEKALRMLHDK